jgi:hypothetical protein
LKTEQPESVAATTKNRPGRITYLESLVERFMALFYCKPHEVRCDLPFILNKHKRLGGRWIFHRSG